MPDPVRLQRVEQRLRDVERRTGVAVALARLVRADVYHGLRWRAFALGAAVAGAGIALEESIRPGLPPSPVAYWAVVGVLGGGLLFALAATLFPAVARLFLEPLRAEAELRQRAAVIFLERELFATPRRTAVLLVIGRFERRAVVMADRGFQGRVSGEKWRALEHTLTSQLRAGPEDDAMLAGLEALERLLVDKGFAGNTGQAGELAGGPLAGPDAP